MDFKVLAVGDVVGNPGVERVRRSLRWLKRNTGADFVIVNGENAAVVGITPQQAEDILDGFTEPVSGHTEGSDVGAVGKEAIEALTALGYSASEASGVVKKVTITESMTAEDVLKAALKHLAFL